MGQHAQHADAFNAAAKQLGGKAQTKPDPAFVPVVKKAVAGLCWRHGKTRCARRRRACPRARERRSRDLHQGHDAGTSATNRALFASIMGIEAQHVSVLLAVQALLMAGAPQSISLAPGTAAATAGGRWSRWIPRRLLQDQYGRCGEPGAGKSASDDVRGFGGRIRTMTTELDELHKDVGMLAMAEGIANMIDSMGESASQNSPRTSLVGAGATAQAALQRRSSDRLRPRWERRLPRFRPSRPPAPQRSRRSGSKAIWLRPRWPPASRPAVFPDSAGLSAATAGNSAQYHRLSPPCHNRSRASSSARGHLERCTQSPMAKRRADAMKPEADANRRRPTSPRRLISQVSLSGPHARDDRCYRHTRRRPRR